MSLDGQLKSEYPDIEGWDVVRESTKERERINQSTEITSFVATSPDGRQERRFTYTLFTDHRGFKESWNEI